MILLLSFPVESGWFWVGVMDDETSVLVVSIIFQVELLCSSVAVVGVELLVEVSVILTFSLIVDVKLDVPIYNKILILKLIVKLLYIFGWARKFSPEQIWISELT